MSIQVLCPFSMELFIYYWTSKGFFVLCLLHWLKYFNIDIMTFYPQILSRYHFKKNFLHNHCMYYPIYQINNFNSQLIIISPINFQHILAFLTALSLVIVLRPSWAFLEALVWGWGYTQAFHLILRWGSGLSGAQNQGENLPRSGTQLLERFSPIYPLQREECLTGKKPGQQSQFYPRTCSPYPSSSRPGVAAFLRVPWGPLASESAGMLVETQDPCPHSVLPSAGNCLSVHQ